jgi:myo-inositol-1(or 4)-monophosphatase
MPISTLPTFDGNFEVLTAAAESAAREAGAFLQREQAKVKPADIFDKSLNNLVSYVDRETEKILVERLRAALPSAGFIAEEGTAETNGSDYQWIVDPLDGTTNYLHGLPAFAVSIALAERGVPVVGVVYHVSADDMFSTWQGAPAFRNGRPIHVADPPALSDALLATGFPYYRFEGAERYAAALLEFMRTTRGIRRFGSAALDLAWTASGHFNGFFESSLSPWDVAAGALLVRHAGGIVTDYSGGDQWLFGQQIMAAAPAIHPQMLAVIQRAGLAG